MFGLSGSTGARIVAERTERRFASLADFADRVRPSIDELEALILAGAFDWTGRSRPSLLLEARVTPSGAAVRGPALVAPDGSAVMPQAAPPIATPALPEFDLAERVRGELRSTGLWFSAHPLDVFVDPAARRGTTPIAAVDRLALAAGERVALVGLRCAARRVETRQGGLMLFTTLAGRDLAGGPGGFVECVLFPDIYREYAEAMQASILRIEGRVDRTLDAVTIVVERATPLDRVELEPAASEARGRSGETIE